MLCESDDDGPESALGRFRQFAFPLRVSAGFGNAVEVEARLELPIAFARARRKFDRYLGDTLVQLRLV